MFAWYRNLRMTPKIVLPVTIVLVLSLGFLTWQIQSKSSAAIEEVAKRELAALAGQNANYVRNTLNLAVNDATALADSLEVTLSKGVPPSRETVIAMEEGLLWAIRSSSAAAPCGSPTPLTARTRPTGGFRAATPRVAFCLTAPRVPR